MACSLGSDDKRKPKISVSGVCLAAGISRKTYYQKSAESKDGWLTFWIEQLQKKSGFTLGTRGLKGKLHSVGINTSRRKIKRIMDKYRFNCRIRIKKVPDGYYKKQKKLVKGRKNLIRRHFHAFKPYTKLVTDITYLKCTKGFVYLSAIKDLFNHEIVAYLISNQCNTTLCVDTVDMLVKDKILMSGSMTLHSDQGCTYTADLYCQKLKDLGINQSFSRVGNCWDNASMESFFGTLKDYIRANCGTENYKRGNLSSDRIIQITDEFIEYYNTSRKQESLGQLSPREYLLQNKNGTGIVLYDSNRIA